MATSFIISIIAVVIRAEFSKRIEELQHNINETNSLSHDTFSEGVERFQQLKALVNKVDNSFCLILSLNLSLSLGILCTSIYSIYIGETTFEDMKVGISVSFATLVVLLPSSAALHSKVGLSQWLPHLHIKNAQYKYVNRIKIEN